MNAQPLPESGWLRPEQAASYLNISRRCLATWMKRKLIPYTKISHRVVLLRKCDMDAALSRLTTRSVLQP